MGFGQLGKFDGVMFWDAFVGLQIPMQQLEPFDGVFIGFFKEQVQVMGYIEV